jgi:hypothetical protein
MYMMTFKVEKMKPEILKHCIQPIYSYISIHKMKGNCIIPGILYESVNDKLTSAV